VCIDFKAENPDFSGFTPQTFNNEDIMRILPLLTLGLLFFAVPAMAANDTCKSLPDHDALKAALVEARKADNGGLNLDMWGTIVDRSGIVCAVAYSGEDAGSQWPGSRVISAQKANAANAFSVKGLALSTANLYAATQPGGSLFGLQESNPVNINVAYKGSVKDYGTSSDPLTGERIGGVNVFGGGFALYNDAGEIVGGIGVSGDTSCADHNIGWRTRHTLNLDFVPAGVAADKSDTIIYDVKGGKSVGGFGHPTCGGKEDAIAKTLVKVQKAAVKTEPAKTDPKK
jgi:uncharacterized protein GlcG (DUF336 family)